MVEFHANGKLVKGSNNSFICLIPKKDNPQKVRDFRPIFLIGCIDNIWLKLLANRIRGIMSKVISEFQSAFVSGHQNLDGVVIANELVEEAWKRKCSTILFNVVSRKLMIR